MSDTVKNDLANYEVYNYETIMIRRLNYRTIKEKEIFIKIRLKKLVFYMLLE